MSRVLIACEYSATVRDAFRARGFDAREIEGFPGYVVTACGQVFSRNHPTGPLRWFKPLKGHIDKKGYHGLTLCNADGHFPRRVHRLVADAFHPNPDDLPCVRHINSNPGDNRAENLAWSTYVENEADKRAHGRHSSEGQSGMTPTDQPINWLKSAVWTGVVLASVTLWSVVGWVIA